MERVQPGVLVMRTEIESAKKKNLGCLLVSIFLNLFLFS